MSANADIEFKRLQIGIIKAVYARQHLPRWRAAGRAVWYGGQSRKSKVTGFVIHTAAHKVGVGATSAAATAAVGLAAPLVPLVALTVPIWGVVAINGIVENLAIKGLDTGIQKGHSRLRDGWKQRSRAAGGTTQLAADEKQVENILPTIERNLNKLTDARRAAEAAFNNLNKALSLPASSSPLEKQQVAAEDAMWAVYEVAHYQVKLRALNDRLAEAVDKFRDDLNRLEDPLTRQIDAVEKAAKAIVAVTLANSR